MPDTFDRFTPPDRGLFGDNEHAPARLKDFTLVLHRDDPNDKAILLSETGEEGKAFWLARSLIEYRDTGMETNGKRCNGQAVTLVVVEVTMPIWLATQRGLI